jgi:hypothetical protein
MQSQECGTIPVMPKELPKDVIEQAEAAVAFAQQVRRLHRRRTDKSSLQRTQDIELAILRLKEAMAPLRSEIGRFPYGPQTDAAEANRERIREVSTAVQRERRKLWKMRGPIREEAA